MEDGLSTLMGVVIGLHRSVWIYHYGSIPDGYEIDHRSGNTLDSRIDRLRLATHAQNSKNQKVRLDNISGKTGVCWDSRENRWRSFINADNVHYELGLFEDFDDAVAIRIAAEKEKHGEFSQHLSRG